MKPPIIRLPAREPLQGYYVDQHGSRWNIARLIDDTKDLKSFDCPVAALDLSEEIWAECSMALLALHCKKMMEADLSKPIILSWDGSIADGRHRILKAIVEGKRIVKAVRMNWRPDPCSEAPDD